jgi:hypothetical protein
MIFCIERQGKMAKEELKRKTFNEVISESYTNYLKKKHQPKRFDAIDTPNRNPRQVSTEIWTDLIHMHVNNHYKN